MKGRQGQRVRQARQKADTTVCKALQGLHIYLQVRRVWTKSHGHSVTPNTSRRTVVLWICLGVALLGGVLCYSGFVMASSFTVSNPERLEHWRKVAYLYLGFTGICALAAFALAVALYHRRDRPSSGGSVNRAI